MTKYSSKTNKLSSNILLNERISSILPIRTNLSDTDTDNDKVLHDSPDSFLYISRIYKLINLSRNQALTVQKVDKFFKILLIFLRIFFT